MIRNKDLKQSERPDENAADYRSGKIAYDAYCTDRKWLSVRGDKLPQFEQQIPELRQAWIASAKAVIKAFIKGI